MHEIAWTRILSLVLGPTIYAFAATLAAVIGGVAIGSAAGAWLVAGRAKPAVWLAFALAAAAISASYTYSLAGGEIARLVAGQMASSPNLFDERLRQGLLITAALVLPTAVCLGAAFPLALVDRRRRITRASPAASGSSTPSTRSARCSGSLAAGFVFIPRFGLQPTLQRGERLPDRRRAHRGDRGSARRRAARAAGLAAAAAAAVMLVFSPPWDRELLASGVYMYAPYVPKDLDLETLLKAGTLLYYREGAAATVSVKRLTGTTTLAVDGKIDASNRGDMLTQKLVAHLPLLLHDNPREVGIIGLGSGVTVGAALRHPIARVDVDRDLAGSRRGVALFRGREPPRARRSAHPPDRRRRPLAPAADRSHLRRHHLGAVEPVDCRRRRAVHARVLRGGARPPRARRHHLPVGERLQHQRRRSPVDRRDVPVGVSRRHGLAGRRGRCAARGVAPGRSTRGW